MQNTPYPNHQKFSTLDHALALAARGLPVLPFDVRTKRPATAHGMHDATTNEATIRAWFARAGLIPAIATGERSGIDVLDLDTPRHPEAAIWLEANEARLPSTFCYETRSGGRHYWFRHHPGLHCSAGRPAVGLDVRADGGAAIFWPAIGRPVVCHAAPADWPQWLLDGIAPPPKPTWAPPAPAPWHGSDRRARAYAEGTLARAVRAVATAAPGTRNAALNREAYALARLVGNGSLTPSEITYALASGAQAAGLPGPEIAATLKSALRAGGAQ